MSETKMTREEVLRQIKSRMAEREKDEPSYWDWWYNILEVEVCDIDTDDDKIYRVPEYIGKIVCDIIEDTSRNNEVIELGVVRFRSYMVKRAEFKKARFTSLSNWGKKMLLEQNPNLLSEHENNFSPRLKEYLNEIRKSGSEMKALPKPEDWILE